MQLIASSFLAISVLVCGIVYGHTGATGIVKERMDAMEEMGDQAKIVSNMFKEKTVFNREAVSKAAGSFVEHSRSMEQLFPDTHESRTGAKTRALPKLWEDWGDFVVRTSEFVNLSEALQQAVAENASKPELKKAFKRATKACSGCHKRYRKPER